MGAAPKIIDKKILQGLVPFNALSPVHFNEVVQKTTVEELRAGRVLFKEGEHDNQSVYLIEGEVALLSGKDTVGSISGGSDAARHPIAQQQPRQVTARAKTNIVVARVDSSLLDIMLTWDQSSGYEVAEIDDDDETDDWMTRILQSQAFLKLPPSNIQRLLMSVESINVKAGDVIIRQGSEGDYFYIIKNGRCAVTRKPSANGKEVKLAELANGDAFGEDALVSDAKRNATVTMVTDGALMRLAKKDFIELLKEPLLNRLSYAEAEKLIRKGAELLDVRLPGEFENVHLVGSHNLPLSALRLEASTLDTATKYIVCCDTGRRSASAAFVLSQRGFDVYVLDDGFARVPAEALTGTGAAITPSADEPTAEVVELKPQRSPAPEAVVTTVPDTARVSHAGAMEDVSRELAQLEADRDAAIHAREQAEQQLADAQEELDRMRGDIREQMQEFELSLNGLRKENSDYLAELQRLKSDSELQRQSEAVVREQSETLEKAFEELRAAESGLQSELKTLQAERTRLEAELERNSRLRNETDAALADQKARIAELEPLAGQLKSATDQIQALELQLEKAATSGVQAESEARQELVAAREQLAAAERDRADLSARLQAAEEAVTAERSTSAAQQEAADQAATEAHEQLASLKAEFAALGVVNSDLQVRLAELEGALQTARSTEQEALASSKEAETRLRRQLDETLSELTTATQERADLRQSLEDVSAKLQALNVDADQQVTQLQAALDAAQQDAHVIALERDRLQASDAARQDELAVLRVRLAELEQTSQCGGEAQRVLEEERDRLHAELETARVKLAEAEQRHAEFAALQDQLAAAKDQLAAEHSATDAAMATLQQERDQLQAELAASQSAIAQLQQGEDARLDELQQSLAVLQAQLSESQAQHDAAERARQELEARLQEQDELAQRIDTLRDERDRLQGELNTAGEQVEHLRRDKAAREDAQRQALDQLRQEVTTLKNQLSESDTAREEIEARIAEMSAAAEEAQLRLEEAQQVHAEALKQAKQQAQADFDIRLRELQSELDTARTTLVREQSKRANLEEANKAQIKAEVRQANEQASIEIDRLRNALDDVRNQLEEANGRLTDTDSAKKAAEAELLELRKLAEAQQKALQAELEQLQMVTTSDLQAMQKQLVSLQEELKATRNLNAGKPADEELSRLRLLLDEAREEAASVRSDLEQWREQASVARADAEQWREQVSTARADADHWRVQAHANAIDDEEATDELAAMRIQMVDIQSRVDDALRLRDEAQREVELLRVKLQQNAVGAMEKPARPAFATETAPARRGGLWMGMVAGILLGVLGAGGALWYHQQGAGAGGREIRPASPAPAPSPAATAEPVESTPKQPAADPVSPAANDNTKANTNAKPVSSKRREFSDQLGEGFRGPLMVELSAATFSMGSGGSSLDADERPRHDVRLGRFAIGKHEVTFDQFDAFARATGRALLDDKGWGRGSRPVFGVSWDDAVAYAEWLSQLTGNRYRLPTEAEWEYAAGGDSRLLYWWGNSLGEGRANCFNCGSEWDASMTAPVGSFKANPLGLHDTAGNVAEWVQDCYHASYEGAPGDGSAWLSAGCSRRVVRGGGFNSPADSLRTSKRDQQLASSASDDIGFRVVREL